jgi:ferredoxin-thioredoxin reductase catalytic chain
VLSGNDERSPGRGVRRSLDGLQAQWPLAPRGGFGALGSIDTKQLSFVISLRCEQPATAASMSDAANSASAAAPVDGAPLEAAPKAADSLEVIRKFAETYAKRTGTYFCSDPGVTAVVLEGLARHKDELGGALCPCRHYEDKEAEVAQAFWNCPCVPMRERKECHCMLFLTEDNPFRCESQTISLEDVQSLVAG